MTKTHISHCFNLNIFYYKIFGLWPVRKHSICSKLYSFLFLFVFFVIYNILLTLNLYYTPRTIELLISEVIFYFTELTLVGKVSMILFNRKKILEAFDLLDSEFFKGDDDISTKIVENSVKQYSYIWKLYMFFSHLAYISLIIPIFPIIFDQEIVLPISNYYFLSDDIRDSYFIYWYLYQTVGMYAHMTYNINIDSFTNCLIFYTITQLRVIKYKLYNVKLAGAELQENKDAQEEIMRIKLLKCLKHYDVVLRYNSVVQEIMNLAMFMQFGFSSLSICVVLCGLTIMNSTTEAMVFMVIYSMVMVGEIFVPAWLGSQLSYENQKLVFAAYNTDWIPRSEKFKRTLRLFVERANTPMIFIGLKMFPLVLSTFISIMRLSYSFFSVVRRMQDLHVQE